MVEARLKQVLTKPAECKKDGSMLREKYANFNLTVIMDTPQKVDYVTNLLDEINDEDVYLDIQVIKPTLAGAMAGKSGEGGVGSDTKQLLGLGVKTV